MESYTVGEILTLHRKNGYYQHIATNTRFLAKQRNFEKLDRCLQRHWLDKQTKYKLLTDIREQPGKCKTHSEHYTNEDTVGGCTGGGGRGVRRRQVCQNYDELGARGVDTAMCFWRLTTSGRPRHNGQKPVS